VKRAFSIKRIIVLFILVSGLISFGHNLLADNIYELRKLTEDEWLSMSTEDRLRALSTTTRHAEDQAFLGDFGRHYDLYKKWGYEYYEMDDRYENYSFRNFEPYNIIEERRKRWTYNEFGDRITKMVESFRVWSDRFYQDGQWRALGPSGYINQFGTTDGVWVARESTSDWSVSVIGAGALRTNFTPLTLAIPNMNGISIDFQSANTTGKFISSVLVTSGSNMLGHVNEGGVMLRGGRFRRKFGALTLGTTYVTTYGVQGNRDKGREWRGTVNNFTPTPMMVAVRFEDDSPQDGVGGPIVYNIRLRINGKYRDDVQPQIIMDNLALDRTSAITNKIDNAYIEPTSQVVFGFPAFDYFSIGNTPLMKYSDYNYLNDLMKGNNVTNVAANFSKSLSNSYFNITEFGSKPLQADGNECIVCIFDLASITETLRSVEAVTTVANDYRIQTAMIYALDPKGGHDTAGKNSSWYDATYWRTEAQCEGNIKDGSNVTTLTLDFGFEVANVMYGIDADFNYRGFKIKGEFVNNIHTYMFADGLAGTGKPIAYMPGLSPRKGHRFTKTDNAYYVTAEKGWSHIGFAGEIFKMGKNFRPYMDYFFGQNYRQLMRRNNTTRVTTVEDNDDDDQYADQMLVQRAMGYRILSSDDPDGVYPGNDADNDGIADTNKNFNEIPDYTEPFYMFDIDPDDFVFGNDYNNNTIPDFREDDMKFDTPYDLDRQGHHFYITLSPITSIHFIAGSSHTQGVGASSFRTNEDYAKLQVNYNVFEVGRLYAEYRYEKIQDNIRDQYIQARTWMKTQYVMGGGDSLGRFDRDIFFDELWYRNSNVQRLWIDSNIRAIPSITLENYIKLENNEQLEGIMYDSTFQPYDMVKTYSMVNKLVYTKQWGNWVFSPGLKFRFYKKSRSESLQPLDHYLMRMPLVMFKYIVSPKTNITLALQGFPSFELDYNDYVQTTNDYRRKSYCLQIQNRTNYFGYNIWGACGLTFDEISYNEEYRKAEEYKTSGTFVKINVGWD
jgi:hypothetical protein